MGNVVAGISKLLVANGFGVWFCSNLVVIINCCLSYVTGFLSSEILSLIAICEDATKF